MHRDTTIPQAGLRSTAQSGPFVPSLQFAATYTTPGDPSAHELTYGRFHNPTWSAWERALGVLDGGHAVSFASGMAAVAAVFRTCLRPGDAVVLSKESYYTTRVLASSWLSRIGVDVRMAATRNNAQLDVLKGRP